MLDAQVHRNHVDDGMATTLAQYRQYLLCLIMTHEFIRKDTFYILNALLNDLWII